jgi:hypothetical protein
MGLGISYRYAPGFHFHHASSDLINQFNIKLTMRFGKF